MEHPFMIRLVIVNKLLYAYLLYSFDDIIRIHILSFDQEIETKKIGCKTHGDYD